MQKDPLKRLKEILSREEIEKLGENAPRVAHALLGQVHAARALDETISECMNAIRQTCGEEAADACQPAIMAYIQQESGSTCLASQEVAQIVAPEVKKLILRGIPAEYAVKIGIRNAGKHIFEANAEKAARHFFG